MSITINEVKLEGNIHSITKLNKEKVRSLIKSGVLDYRHLGLLTMLSYMCRCPKNIIRDKEFKPMNFKQIMNELNMDDRTLQRYFNVLEVNKLLYILKGNDNKSNNYAISHDFVEKSLYIASDDEYISNMEEDIIKESLTVPVKDEGIMSEKDLESILIENLNIIEDGLTYIDNQYEVENGFIDILARDKRGMLCIIELKITNDNKDIIYQSVYYPTQFEEPVRMITITPGYTKKIKTSLQSLGYVEMKIYELHDDRQLVIKDAF